jgi:hypothetical protein
MMVEETEEKVFFFWVRLSCRKQKNKIQFHFEYISKQTNSEQTIQHSKYKKKIIAQTWSNEKSHISMKSQIKPSRYKTD